MNFKSFALKTAIAATVLTGSTLAVSPAEAITLGSKLNFFVSVDDTTFQNNPAFDRLEFYVAKTRDPGGENIGGVRVDDDEANTGEFVALDGQLGTIKDIRSLPVFEAINNFLSFGEGSPFNFKLTSFVQSGQGAYDFTGIFADNTLGTGRLVTPALASGRNSVAVTIIAGEKIPTPALLPGLIGMGAAVLRKRNAEEGEQVEVEAEA